MKNQKLLEAEAAIEGVFLDKSVGLEEVLLNLETLRVGIGVLVAIYKLRIVGELYHDNQV